MVKIMSRKNKGKAFFGLFVIALLAAGIIVWFALSAGNKINGVNKIHLGLDLAGGVSITYQAVDDKVSGEAMDDTLTKLQLRAEQFSTEAQVYKEGSNRINVDIPGVDNAEEVLKSLGNAGYIYFITGQDKDGNANIERGADGEYVLTKPIDEIIGDGYSLILSGNDVADAKARAIEDQQTKMISYVVLLSLNDQGTEKFREATKNAMNYLQGDLGNIIAIVYDGKVFSAPGVQDVIESGEATISGSKTMEEADNLATVIRIGALPTELESIRSNIVGASLGSNALKTSLLAGAIGILLVCIFMIIFYRVPGIAACISLIFYIGIELGIILAFDITLTLPGIAGIILSIGMAVDANVIIFTRIREEIAKGKTVRTSIKEGYSKAVSAIVDGNVTTLIAALVLYFLGSGVVKGFAITLGIGIMVSMFTGLVTTYWIMKALYGAGVQNEKRYGRESHTKTLNVIQNWKKYVIISGTLIGIGIVMLVVNRISNGSALNFGLDFVGGTSVQVTFPDDPPANAEIEEFVKDITKDSNISVNAVKGSNALIIKTRLQLDESTELQNLKNKFIEKYGMSESDIETETISGTISGEMKRSAIIAVSVALVCMLLYILIRFKNIAFAGSSVLALAHDALVVLGVYAVARITVDTNFIACMLTIVGYSINATIVIFDRLRENLAEPRKNEKLADVVNRSISETFTRSINTSITTLFTVVMLIIFGVDSVRIFAIPMTVGIICGGYSSVCIAGTLWYFFKTRADKKKAVTM